MKFIKVSQVYVIIIILNIYYSTVTRRESFEGDVNNPL